MFLHVLAGAVGRVNIFTVSSQGYTEALVLCEVCPPVPAFLLSAGKEMGDEKSVSPWHSTVRIAEKEAPVCPGPGSFYLGHFS